MNLANYKIGILCGGESREREISLKSGQAIYETLKEEGLNVVKIDAHRDIMKVMEKETIDIAFLALHGGWGEDGVIQAICRLMGIPFTSSDVLGSALAMDKLATKKVLKSEGILTPPSLIFSKKNVHKIGYLENFIQQVQVKLDFPVVLKPVREGSTIGVKVIRKISNLESELKKPADYGDLLIVEKYINSTEVTVGILGLRNNLETLPIIEIVPKNEIYDFKSKYTLGETEYIVPARISEDMSRKVQTVALQTSKALNLEIISRIDMLIENKNIYVMEANSIPGLTRISLIPRAARSAGYEFSELAIRMLELSIKRECNIKNNE